MARTLWGNILELMAATGLQTAAKVGASAITTPMLAQKQAANDVLQNILIPSYRTATDENVGPIAEKIKQASGIDLSTGQPMANAAGIETQSPTGATLTMPKSNLMDLAEGYKTQPGFIKAPPTLEQMKTTLARTLSPEEQKTAFFPKDATLEAGRLNLLANIASREGIAAENRASRENIAQGNQDIRLQLGQLAAEGRNQQRQFTQMYLQDRLDEMKRRGATADETKELGQFISLQNQIGLAQGDQKKTLQIQLNNMIKGTKNPMLQAFPAYTEDVAIPGTGYFGTNLGATKEKVPVGAKTTTQPTTKQPTKPIPTLADLDAELKRRGEL